MGGGTLRCALDGILLLDDGMRAGAEEPDQHRYMRCTVRAAGGLGWPAWLSWARRGCRAGETFWKGARTHLRPARGL